ncbi:hypothetical protein C5167_041333 [Papaver somniferum]|uniref:Uncharacterized protein n=1 Tax=Papaver somniferum TaxID=3469 RepID=A0A4Y7IKY6_PAPSO|nr:hypothetical protein C5167_041333 [Papaver somniferum]
MTDEMTWIDRLIEQKRLEHAELAKHPKPKSKPPSEGSWIDAYFARLSVEFAYHRSREPLIGSRSQIKKQDLEVSLKMFLQEAAYDADDWTDVNRRYGNGRSFSSFLWMLKMSGLDKYASYEDNDIDICYQPNTWLHLEASPDDVVIADKYYDGSLWLMKLLKRIRSESGDDFRREQARLLESFLDHLIKIQQGQQHKCPLILSKHTVDYYIWRQKHLFDSLCTMSRESAWLLKKLKDSPFSSPSSIDQSSKILDIILVYILKFKESKEQGVKTKSVAETLLKCFVDVVDMSDKRGNPYGDTRSSLQCVFSEVAKETSELIYEAVEKLKSVKHSDLTGGGSPLGCIALWKIIFESSLINLRLDCICEKYSETVKLGVKPFDTATNNQLDQIRLSINQLLTVGKSILVEFMDMQKAVAEVTYTLGDAFTTGGAGMRGSSQDRRPRTSIWKVAEVPYTLGAGKQDDQVMNFNLDDFPWDKHNVPEFSKTGPTHKDEIF